MSSNFDPIDQRWHSLKRQVAEEYQRGNAEFDIADQALKTGIDWVRTVKTVREFRGCNVPTAQEYVLGHKGWQQIVRKMLKSNSQCRSQARFICRTKPDNPLIRMEGDRYTIILQPTR